VSRLTFIGHTVPGLERITAYELGLRGLTSGPIDALSVAESVAAMKDRKIDAFFWIGGLPTAAVTDLLTARTLEDLFVRGAEMEGFGWNYAGLRTLREQLTAAPELEPAVALALHEHSRLPRRISFRVIARLAGEHTFRRVDLQEAVGRAMLDRFPAWRSVEERATLEVWSTVVEEQCVVGIRLSDNTLRQRTYKQTNLPASLKPTVAAAMVAVSQPRDDDVVLDPMCGAGTLLIERAQAGRYRQLLGGDIAPDAFQAARENIGPRYQPIELRQWDARALPIEAGTVTVILSNLPFGRQIGTPRGVRSLYPELLSEWSRVLAPGGRMVLLTSERDLLARAVAAQPGLRIVDRSAVLLRGRPATIHLIHQRTSAAAGTQRRGAKPV